MMKKVGILVLFLIASIFLFSFSVSAYTNTAGTCMCNSCGDCSAAFIDSACSTVKLSGDINFDSTGTNGVCVNVNGATGKTFDMAGFTIRVSNYDYAHQYVILRGISIAGSKNMEVKNGKFSNFYINRGPSTDRALHLSYVNNSKFTNLIFENNTQSILTDNAGNNAFTNLSFKNNLDCLDTYYSSNNVYNLIECTGMGGGGKGFYGYLSNDNSIINSNISLIGDYAVWISGQRNKVTYTNVRSSLAGIYISGNSTLIKDVVVYNTQRSGIKLDVSSNSVVDSVLVFNNSEYGIFIDGNYNTIKNTNVSGNYKSSNLPGGGITSRGQNDVFSNIISCFNGLDSHSGIDPYPFAKPSSTNVACDSGSVCTKNCSTYYSSSLCAHGVCYNTPSGLSACSSNGCNSEGERKCFGSSYQQCTATNGCLAWSNPLICAQGYTCTGSGACTLNQICTPGTPKAGTQCFICNADGTGYPTNHTVCASGKCNSNTGMCEAQGNTTSTCTNACSTAGVSECSGNGNRICGNYDSDSCLEWSNVNSCNSGQSCVSGTCVGSNSSSSLTGFTNTGTNGTLNSSSNNTGSSGGGYVQPSGNDGSSYDDGSVYTDDSSSSGNTASKNSTWVWVISIIIVILIIAGVTALIYLQFSHKKN